MAQYATTTEADQYFAERLATEPWDDATENDRNKALAQATRMIDRLNFHGEKFIASQALQWPRKNVPRVTDGVTPNDIKIASYEIAIQLLDQRDPDRDFETLFTRSERAFGVAKTYDRAEAGVPPHVASGIPSFTAWTYLVPYLSRGRDVRLIRVS